MIVGIAQTQETLDFYAKHKNCFEIEVMSADDIDTTYERVVAFDVCYRFVIDNTTISSNIIPIFSMIN